MKHMRRILLLSFLFLLIASSAFGQRKRRGGFTKKKPPYRYEWIGHLGASNFLGDLGGADQIGTNGIKDLEYVLTRPAMGIGMRFKFQQYFSAKGNLMWGIVRGDDALTKEFFRNRRNINFRSPVIELSGQVEFNFMREQKGHIYKIKGVRGMKRKDRQIYLFGGGGITYFNPKGKHPNGKWYTLQPLHTEGQGILPDVPKPYARITPIISVGGGFRFSINRYWGVGFELGMRKTFTDYMDDTSTEYPDPSIFNGDPIATHFSNPADQTRPDICYPCTGEQRGDKTDKDAYMFGAFTVGYKVMYRKRSRSKF